MITPQEAMEDDPEETIKALEVGIDQQLNDEFIKWGDVVPIDLPHYSEKVLSGLIVGYEKAGWTIEKKGCVLLFTAQKKEGPA